MVKAIKVAKLGIKRKEGYLYYVDKDGDVAMIPMNRGGKSTTKPAKKSKKTEKPKKKTAKVKATKSQKVVKAAKPKKAVKQTSKKVSKKK